MRILDLFSGAGGFSLGFKEAFPCAEFVSYEFDKHCIETYNANFGTDYECQDVSCIEEYPKADMVIGGPPCQGFSAANTRKRENDRRNSLYLKVLQATEISGARAFVIENVPGFFKPVVSSKILDWCENNGFIMTAHKFNVSDYGVATIRSRWIVLGVRREDFVLWIPPAKVYPTPTVRDAIGDLPPPSESREKEVIDWHSYSDTHEDRYRASLVPKNIPRPKYNCLLWLREHYPDLIFPTYRDRPTTFFPQVYGRMDWDLPAPTIKTTFNQPCCGAFTHPDGERTITLREGARIQSFPDWFVFRGGKGAVAKQIGNSVPPIFVKHIAMSIKQYMIDAKIL